MESKLLVAFQSIQGFQKENVALLAINAGSYTRNVIHYNKEKEGLDGQFGEKKDDLPGSEKSHIQCWPC